MRTLVGRRVAGLAAVGAASLAACSGAGPQEFMSLGTGGTGGIYYPMGGFITARLSIADSLRQYTAEVTGGGVENVNRLREGQIDLGFAPANTVYEAATGGLDYDEPVKGLRIVAPIFPSSAHILVSRSFTGSSVADFAGRTVSVGSAGSGTEQMSRQILEVHGLGYDDVTVRYLSFTESAAALRDGALDAAIFSVGYPAAAVLDATAGGARLLPMAEEKIEELRRRHPYYTSNPIPQGAYAGMESDVVTAGLVNWLVAMSDLSDDVVGHVVHLVLEDREQLEQVYDIAKQIDENFLLDAPIELHPATRKWMEANLNRLGGRDGAP